MLIKPDGTGVQRTVSLSRAEIKQFHDMEALLQRLGLRFSIYCNRCRQEGLPDGCWGNNQTNDSQYVIECRCTRRVYQTGIKASVN